MHLDWIGKTALGLSCSVFLKQKPSDFQCPAKGLEVQNTYLPSPLSSLGWQTLGQVRKQWPPFVSILSCHRKPLLILSIALWNQGGRSKAPVSTNCTKIACPAHVNRSAFHAGSYNSLNVGFIELFQGEWEPQIFAREISKFTGNMSLNSRNVFRRTLNSAAEE